jgi:trehalose 6-phosphate synthase
VTPAPGRRGERSGPRIVVASNRGPVSFAPDEEGRVVAKRGVGGLVTALSGALHLRGGLWVAAAMTEEDRARAGDGPLRVDTPGGGAYDVRYLAFPMDLYDRFYNEISNRVLWFVHHYLWDTSRRPSFDDETRRSWSAYRRVNQAFAEALAQVGASGDVAYLIQDYHLALVPALLRSLQPEARIAHFSHIPFAEPSYFRILPAEMREALLAGYLGADVVGFHTERWADSFLLNCREHPGAKADLGQRRVRWQGRDVRVREYPISIDVHGVEEQARSARATRATHRLEAWLGDAKLILRVDRTELSKNILRGLEAYETFLRQRPDWRRRVRFLVLLNPSREALPEYQTYLRRCLRAARRINQELGEPGWEPIRVSVRDDYPMALAAYGMYDVLMVNPVFDGMNLVAKEGPLLNRRSGVLILSENAGAFAELGRHAVGVNPFDISQGVEAIATALEMGPAERARRAAGLRQAVVVNRLDRWVERQLQDLKRTGRAQA